MIVPAELVEKLGEGHMPILLQRRQGRVVAFPDEIVDLQGAGLGVFFVGDLEGFATDGWHREQALSRFDALRIFTQNAAYAAFQEEELGTIEVGNLADFSVFNQDLMTIEDEEILATEPVMTIVGGEIVWQAAD